VPEEDNKQQGGVLYAVCCVCGAHGPWARFRSSLSPTVRLVRFFHTPNPPDNPVHPDFKLVFHLNTRTQRMWDFESGKSN